MQFSAKPPPPLIIFSLFGTNVSLRTHVYNLAVPHEIGTDPYFMVQIATRTFM